MADKEQLIIGENFLHLEEYVRYKWGIEGLELYRSKNRFLIKNILTEKYYLFSDYVESLRLIEDLFKDERASFDIGWHRAKHLLLAKGSSATGLEVITKVASAWNKFNNFGTVFVKENDDGTASVFVRDYMSAPQYCERMRGFLTGLAGIEKTNQDKVKKVNCVCDGNDSCEFVIAI